MRPDCFLCAGAAWGRAVAVACVGAPWVLACVETQPPQSAAEPSSQRAQAAAPWPGASALRSDFDPFEQARAPAALPHVHGVATAASGASAEPAASHHEPAAPAGADASPVHPEKAAAYVCPMHPEVRRSEPGTCPVCGMTLVPSRDKTGAGDAP